MSRQSLTFFLVFATACNGSDPTDRPSPSGGDSNQELPADGESSGDTEHGDTAGDALTGDNLTGGDTLPVCVADDAYEPNDSSDEAASLAAPGTFELVGCDHHDWYAFDVPAGYGLLVEMSYLHSEADLDIYLYRASAPTSGIRYSRGITDSEELSYDVFEQNTSLLLEVRNLDYEERPNAAYTLTITLYEGGYCLDDEYEPNDAAETATAIPEPVTYGVLCGTNPDYYTFQMQRAGEDARVRVDRDEVPVSVELQVAGGDGTPVGSLVQDDAEETSTLSFASSAGETYLLRIANTSSTYNTPLAYTLRVEGPSPENDTCAAATVVNASGRIAGTTHRAANDIEFEYNSCVTWGAGAPDVAYSVEIPSGTYLDAVLSSSADLTLYLLEDCATRCCWAGVDDYGNDGDERLVYHNTTDNAQNLFLIVDSSYDSNTSADFTLDLSFTASQPPDSTPQAPTECLQDLP